MSAKVPNVQSHQPSRLGLTRCKEGLSSEGHMDFVK